MKNALFFNTMLTPKIITFVYWIILLFVLLVSANTIFSSWDGLNLSNLVLGLFYAFSGVISARIFCELLIVLFTINDSLQELKKK